jgi:hypothetical protein
MIFQAQKISSLVRTRLSCACSGGSVHSAFGRTVNILGDGPEGESIWVSIHAPDVAMHPHAVIVEPLGHAEAGSGAAKGAARAKRAAARAGVAGVGGSNGGPCAGGGRAEACPARRLVKAARNVRDGVARVGTAGAGAPAGGGSARAGAAGDSVASPWVSASGLLGAFVGEGAWLTSTEIILGDGRVTIRLAGAQVWSSPPLTAGHTRRTQARRAAGLIRDWLEGEEIISPFIRVTPGVGSVERALGRRCAAIRNDLAEAWRLGDAARAALAMAGAVGLGAGLTPSGDDFLTGFLGAARLTEYGNGLRRQLSRHLYIDKSMTTLPSYFMLEGALAGFLPEAVSCLLGALADEDPHRARHWAGRLAGLGATSGQDMLAGVICCLEATAEAGDLI